MSTNGGNQKKAKARRRKKGSNAEARKKRKGQREKIGAAVTDKMRHNHMMVMAYKEAGQPPNLMNTSNLGVAGLKVMDIAQLCAILSYGVDMRIAEAFQNAVLPALGPETPVTLDDFMGAVMEAKKQIVQNALGEAGQTPKGELTDADKKALADKDKALQAKEGTGHLKIARPEEAPEDGTPHRAD